MAGFNDAGSIWIDLINSFLLKYILRSAKSVRFLVLLTQADIKESRGTSVRANIEIVEKMCGSADGAVELRNSVQSILTKANPQDSTNDLDLTRLSLMECF